MKITLQLNHGYICVLLEGVVEDRCSLTPCSSLLLCSIFNLTYQEQDLKLSKVKYLC